MAVRLEMMTVGYRRGYPAISLLSLWSGPWQQLAIPEFADDCKEKNQIFCLPFSPFKFLGLL